MSDLTPEQRARALGIYRAYMIGIGHNPAVTEHLTLSDDGARAWLAVEEHALASHARPDAESDVRVRAWHAIAEHPFFADCYRRTTDGTLTEAMLAKLDAAHECPSTGRRALGHYRHPRMDGQTECPECGYLMHEHGWLDTGGDGITVCPSLHGPFGGQAVTDHARNHECPPAPVWRPTTANEIQLGWEVRARHPDGMEATWGAAHHKDEDSNWRTEAGSRLTHVAPDWSWTYETTAAAPEPKPWPDELVDAITGTIWPIDRAEDARAVLDLLAARGLLDRAAITEGGQS